jgi:hypothetical protein
MKDEKWRGKCSMSRNNVKCTEGFFMPANLKETDHLACPGAVGTFTLKWVLNKSGGTLWPAVICLGLQAIFGVCYRKDWEIVNQLSDY